MVQFNFLNKEAIYKIIYFGPTGSGKSTVIKYLSQKILALQKGQLSSIVASAKDNLLIDFLTVEAGKITGIKTRFNLFALPSLQEHESVKKLFLQDMDGLMLIADSTKVEENLQEIKKIEKVLTELGLNVSQIPFVIQWNKRDLPVALDLKTLHDKVNSLGVAEFATVATTGQGVFRSLESLSQLVLKTSLSSKQYQLQRKKLALEEEVLEKDLKVPLFQEDNAGTSDMKETPPLEILDRMRETRSRLGVFNPNVSLNEDCVVEETIKPGPHGEIVVFKLGGNINPTSGPGLKSKILSHFAEGRVRLVLNMAKVEYIHSTAFGMLLEMGSRGKFLGGEISLVALNEKFKTQFEWMGMGKAIPLWSTEEEAIAVQPTIEKELTETKTPPKSSGLSWRYPNIGSRSLPPTLKAKNLPSQNLILLSYAPANMEIAKKLEEDLLAQNYSIGRVRQRLESNNAWDPETIQLMQESNTLILLWTNLASKSEIVQHEWLISRALGKKIIPCIVENSAPLPIPLQSLPWIDFRNYEKALAKITSILSLNEPPADYNYSLLPAFSYLPFSLSPTFMERQQELLGLYQLFLTHKNIILAQDPALAETEGVGKTRLALEFAYRFSFAFPDGILWVNAPYFHRDLQMAAYELGLVDVSPNFQLSTTCLRRLKSYISSHPKMLLIFDNLPNPQQLHEEIAPGIIPISLGCKILCTSPMNHGVPDTITFTLEPWTREASAQLISLLAKTRPKEDLDPIKTILPSLGNLPLAIEWVGKFLAKNTQITVAQYCRYLSEPRVRSPQDTGRLGQNTLIAILKRYMESISDDYTQRLLEITSWFPQGSIISQDTLGILVGVATDTVRSQVYLKNPMDRLFELSIVEQFEDNSIRLHPVVHKFLQRAKTSTEIEQQKNIQKKAADRLLTYYQDFSRMEKDYEKRGFLPIMEDLALARSWNPENTDLQDLQKYLLEESHSLKQQRFMPHYFIQQTYSRIFSSIETENAFLKALQDSLPRVSWQKGSFWLKRSNKFRPLHREETDSFFVSGMNRAAFSPNCQQMVFTNFDSLMLWDTTTGKCTQTFMASSAGSRIVLFNSQGSRFLASHMNELKSWNINDVNDVYPILNQSASIQAAALSSRELLATGGKERVIFLFDLLTGKEKGSLKTNSSTYCLAFSRDGSKLLAGGYDKTIALWEMGKNELLYNMRAHCDTVTSLSFSPNGETFASGGKDGQIRIWETTSALPVMSILAHRGEITSLGFCPQGNYLLSAGTDTCLKLWDAASGKLLQTFVSEYPIIQCQFNPEGNYIWACDALPTIYKFRMMKINVSL